MQTYGLLSLLPMALAIALVLLTKRTALSLLAGTLVGAVILYGADAPGHYMSLVYGTLGSELWIWVLLLVGLFGSLVALFDASGGIQGFTNIAVRFCNSQRRSLMRQKGWLFPAVYGKLQTDRSALSGANQKDGRRTEMNDMIRRVQDGINSQSFAKLLGLTVEDAEEGRVVISCQRRPDLLQQTGLLHGGVISALCEASGALAALTVIPAGQSIIGVECKVNLLRPVTADKAVAVAKVLKRGRQLIVVDVEAFNEGSDKIAAKMVFTGTPVEG